MAFNIFKKKKDLDYPEEKASVLDEPMDFGPDTGFGPPQEIDSKQEQLPPMGALPPIGELPPPPMELEEPQMPMQKPKSNFGQGFVPMNQMAPNRAPEMPHLESSMSASLRPPEEEPFHFPEPRKESIFSQPVQSFSTMEKPHVFIKINKYKDVMESVNELHRRIQDAKKDLDQIHGIHTEESSKLKEAAEIILNIEDILRYLETTFTSPEA